MFKPMKPHSKIPQLEDLVYPILASPKLDGIRALNIAGRVLSYNQKPIPNTVINQVLNDLLDYEMLDGELMVQSCHEDFNEVQSVVMSFNHPEEHSFYYNVFDDYSEPTKPFYKRLEDAAAIVKRIDNPHVRLVRHTLIHNAKDLQAYWDIQVGKGYEGCVLRAPTGPYKFGRSTMKEGYALKLKHFFEDEACIIGLEELMHNDDTSTNKLENQIPGDTLGALKVSWQGEEFKIGSGFDADQRKAIWVLGDALIGSYVTFKYQGVSRYNIPRFPVYKTIRGDL